MHIYIYIYCQVKKAANPKHLQEHEIYLKERLEDTWRNSCLSAHTYSY